MLGAIVGDVIGSIFERKSLQSKDFDLFSPQSHFTDDSVLSIAVAEVLLSQPNPTLADYAHQYKAYCRRYPTAGYGSNFLQWACSDSLDPYGSYGNGAPMRVSPVAHVFPSLHQVLQEAEKTALPTHNHPEAVRGAKAIAAATFLGKQGRSKTEIRDYLQGTLGYDLSQSYTTIAPSSVASQDSVPHACIAFLDSQDFEDTIRNAIYIGGDTDTIAAMAGAIAEAFYGGVPADLAQAALDRLDDALRVVVDRFYQQFGPST